MMQRLRGESDCDAAPQRRVICRPRTPPPPLLAAKKSIGEEQNPGRRGAGTDGGGGAAGEVYGDLRAYSAVQNSWRVLGRAADVSAPPPMLDAAVAAAPSWVFVYGACPSPGRGRDRRE